MDSFEVGLDRIEAQRSVNVSHEERKRSYFRNFPTLRSLRSSLQVERVCTRDTKTVPESFLTNIRLSDLFNLPKESVLINPTLFSEVSAGNKKCLEKLRPQMACLKSEQGDSILHLVAKWDHLELMKSIVSECPCLLLVRNTKGQLPLHVAACAGQLHVVKAIVAAITFVSAKLPEEERERLNMYISKDKDGDTPLHAALKDRHMETAACLLKANQQASFLANKDNISPLYFAVEGGDVSLVRAMLNTRGNEGRTCLSYGASIGNYKGVCKLLDLSTRSVYVCNDDGSFPIHIAVETGHMDIVKELIRRCPDSKYLLNKQGQNIVHIEAKYGRTRSGLLGYIAAREMKKKHLTVEQDVDGNTPLHIATINWRPFTVFFLLFSNSHKTKWRYTRNNSGLTALDIAESKVQPNYMFIERVTLMVLLYFHASTPRDRWFKRITRPSKPLDYDKTKDYVSTLLVVAALVATVTFAAGFTIPGGFNSSAPNLGMATLAHDPSLVLFLVFNTLAMQCSVFTIATLIWSQFGDPTLVHRSLNMALPSLFFSLLCMSVAFYCGVLVSFIHVKVLVVLLTITFAFFFGLMVFILGPHVILHIPGIPAAVGVYFLIFVMTIVDTRIIDEQTSTTKISWNQDGIQKKEST
ncbi:hypothetical protein CARUB_v10000444mg [Capsella rubella]|uniref:PGG domain-containing protein n=1 Tax=Capsella rubella TaxID=81985 RepID=R0FDC8_9BRAS|nr:hypothetical protein CARUB_v10000444mg [Capsella rubella]